MIRECVKTSSTPSYCRWCLNYMKKIKSFLASHLYIWQKKEFQNWYLHVQISGIS
jgi:hypothetical protein